MGSPVPVKAHILKPQKLDNNVITNGTILANESVELKCETSGKVTHIYFKEGTQVKKGDLLLKINDEELQAQLLSAKSAFSFGRIMLDRFKSLFEKQGISQQDLYNAHERTECKKSRRCT